MNIQKSIRNEGHRLPNNTGILILLLLTVLSGFLITSYLSYAATRDSIIESEENRTLPLISDNILSHIQSEVLYPIHISSLMANDTFLIDWITNGEKDLFAITAYLRNIKEKYGFTSTFFVSDITHQYYYSRGILKKISETDAHDVWFFDFAELGSTYDLDVDTDQAADDQLTIFINHRIEDSQGKLLGVGGVGLKLDHIGDEFRAIQDEYQHLVYFVDSDGLVQVHPNQELVETRNIKEMPGILDIADEILNSGKTSQIFYYEDSFGKQALSARYFQDFDWYLIVENNQTDALLQAKQSLTRSLLIGVLITLATSILIYFLVKRYEQKIKTFSYTDGLTGLLTRRAFQPMLDHEINHVARSRQPLSILLIDVDDFKEFNDVYGHHAGDAVLRKVSEQVLKSVRANDLVSRWGGDEIVVLMKETSVTQAEMIARRILENISSEPININNEKLSIHVSIGIADADPDNPDENELLQNADQALYKAKSTGKNKIAIQRGSKK